MKESEVQTKILRRSLLVLAVSLLAACSSQQAYNSLKEWQKSECNKRIDNADRLQCLKDADTSYEEYKKQTSQ